MNSNENGLLALLDDIKTFEQEHEIGEAFNFFEAVGMARQEIRHSKFLAFMLNPIASHGLEETFLRSFLDNVMQQTDAPAMSRLDVMLADLSLAEVYTERDHFDITVWLPKQKLLMVIENKIGSSESESQLAKYRERVKQQYPEETFCGVFLTVDGYDGEDPNWTPVGYAAIHAQLQTLLSTPTLSVNTDIYLAIKHYLNLIRKYIVVDDKLIKACRSIYVKHRAALDLIIEHGQISSLQIAAERFLANTQGVEKVVGGGKQRVTFVGNNWKNIASFQVANTSKWTSEYPLAFWFHYDDQKSELSLVLEVGPIREDVEFDREALVLKLREEFGESRSKAISKIYTRIRRGKKIVDFDDIDSISEAMISLWQGFGGSERLKRIDAIVESAC